jgi:hypothetical protein
LEFLGCSFLTRRTSIVDSPVDLETLEYLRVNINSWRWLMMEGFRPGSGRCSVVVTDRERRFIPDARREFPSTWVPLPRPLHLSRLTAEFPLDTFRDVCIFGQVVSSVEVNE